MRLNHAHGCKMRDWFRKCLQKILTKLNNNIIFFFILIKSSSKNVFSIGRKFYKRYWRIVIIYECFQTLTGCCVPNSTKTIVTTRYYKCTITIKMNLNINKMYIRHISHKLNQPEIHKNDYRWDSNPCRNEPRTYKALKSQQSNPREWP